jgi:hypothetical protein
MFIKALFIIAKKALLPTDEKTKYGISIQWNSI